MGSCERLWKGREHPAASRGNIDYEFYTMAPDPT